MSILCPILHKHQKMTKHPEYLCKHVMDIAITCCPVQTMLTNITILLVFSLPYLNKKPICVSAVASIIALETSHHTGQETHARAL